MPSLRGCNALPMTEPKVLFGSEPPFMELSELFDHGYPVAELKYLMGNQI